MADYVARREARRKKILENSHNRIVLITGRPIEEMENDSATKSNLIPAEIEENSSNNIIHPDPDYPTIDETIFHRSSAIPLNGFIGGTTHGNVDRDVITNLFNNLNETKVEERETIVEKLFSFKLDIFFLAFIIQALHEWITERSFSIFLPLFLMNITKMFMMPAKRKSGLTNLLLTLNGISPGKTEKILILAQITKTFVEDALIYLFIIVLTQSICNLWCSGDGEEHII